MKFKRFQPDDFRAICDTYDTSTDSGREHIRISLANECNSIYHRWMTDFISRMQCYSVGMSLLSEEPFREFMKDFCEEWRVKE